MRCRSYVVSLHKRFFTEHLQILHSRHENCPRRSASHFLRNMIILPSMPLGPPKCVRHVTLRYRFTSCPRRYVQMVTYGVGIHIISYSSSRPHRPSPLQYYLVYSGDAHGTDMPCMQTQGLVTPSPRNSNSALAATPSAELDCTGTAGVCETLPHLWQWLRYGCVIGRR